MGFFNNLFNKCKDTEEVVYTKDNWYKENFLQDGIELETNDSFLNSNLKHELDSINLSEYHNFVKTLSELPSYTEISGFNDLQCGKDLIEFVKANNFVKKALPSSLLIGEHIPSYDLKDYSSVNNYLIYTLKNVSEMYNLSHLKNIYTYLNTMVLYLKCSKSHDYEDHEIYSKKYKDAMHNNNKFCRNIRHSFRYSYNESLMSNITMDEFTFIICMFPYTLNYLITNTSRDIYLSFDSVINEIGYLTDDSSPMKVTDPEQYKYKITDCLNYLKNYFENLNNEIHYVFVKKDKINFMNKYCPTTTLSGTYDNDAHWKEDVFVKLENHYYSVAFFDMLSEIIDNDVTLFKHVKINSSTFYLILSSLNYHFNKKNISYDFCLKILKCLSHDIIYLGTDSIPLDTYNEFISTVMKS